MTARYWASLNAVICLVLILSLFSDAKTIAAEPSAKQVVQAMESLLVDAIAKGEQSAVAIALVRRDAEEPSIALRFPFGIARQSLDPTSPDFIPTDYGSGIIVGDTGLILTTLSVLGDVDSSAYHIWHQQRPFSATVVATAPWYDLAVLKVQVEDLKPITFGDAASIKKGQIVIALGNPEAIARDGEVSASWGIVSNLQRRAAPVRSRSNEPLGRETLHHYGTLIQTDAKLDFGYSGGALLNLNGEMIGLTTSYTAVSGSEKAGGLAIPVDKDFRRIVEELKQGKTPEFGFLGVGPEPLEASLRQQGHHGARIASVMSGTPADQAGLRVNDIVSHIDGKPLFDESDLFRHIGVLQPGTITSMRVVRGDISDPNVSVLEIPVTLTKKYVNTIRQPISTAIAPAWRGLRVDYATASASFSEMVERPPADSLYVAKVLPESAAWKSGLRAGDFITHVGDAKVTTPDELIAAVQDAIGEVLLHATKNGSDTIVRTVSP
jgi:serine protease Do